MTGEISLLGNILAIGGLRSKLLGAIKSDIQTVIIPYNNIYQLKDIESKILNKVNIYPVKTAIEAINIAIYPKNNIYSPYNY